jgi:hypothetical protein
MISKPIFDVLVAAGITVILFSILAVVFVVVTLLYS